MPPDAKPLCVIPARGGSKRFPRKNLALFRGRPLVGLTVDTALASDVYSRVIVSTDDEAIAAAARDSGADVRERPPELAGDFITLEPVLLDVVEQAVEGGRVLPERERSGQRRNLGSALGEDEDVVGDLGAADQRDLMGARLDTPDGAADEVSLVLFHDLRERQVVDAASAERRGDRQRPQDEVGLRGDQRHVQARAGQVVQREHGLERGDPSADDDDL